MGPLETPIVVCSDVPVPDGELSRGVLCIYNPTCYGYTSWCLSLRADVSFIRCDAFKVFNLAPGRFLLCPRSFSSYLSAGQVYSVMFMSSPNARLMFFNFEFKPLFTPSNETVVSVPPMLPAPKPPSSSETVWSYDFTNLTSIDAIVSTNYHFSYTAQSDDECAVPAHVWLSPYGRGLELTVFPDDDPFKKGSDTLPRTELRLLPPILEGLSYVATWRSEIWNYTTGDDFGFFQVFGKGAHIMLRYRKGSYQLLCNSLKDSNINANGYAGQPVTDIDVVVDWRVDFLLASKGYVRVYKNKVLVVEAVGDTRSGTKDDNYIKFGPYYQGQTGNGPIGINYYGFTIEHTK